MEWNKSSPFDISQDFLVGIWRNQFAGPSGYGSCSSDGSTTTTTSSRPQSPKTSSSTSSSPPDHDNVDFLNLPFSVLRFLDEQVPSPLDEFARNGVSSELPAASKTPSGLTKTKKVRDILCPFCRNNGESSAVYRSHALRDATGKVTCPVLRRYVCPICKSTGDNAHTISYCPKSTDETKKASAKKAANKNRSAELCSESYTRFDHVDIFGNVSSTSSTNVNKPGDTVFPLPPCPREQVQIQFVPIPVSLASFQNMLSCQRALSSANNLAGSSAMTAGTNNLSRRGK